jgi:BirA family biotin operon repressor/biotin-[acetyl-CoA-carboxylase] ligase
LATGYRALVLGEVDSTNAEAKRRAEEGEAGGLWILARRQTAGRGRRGRAWASKPGNLMATLLLRPEVTAARSAELSFVASLAVAETFEALGASKCALKWPNDVLIQDAKAAGILLESSGTAGGSPDWLAVGFGLNLAWAPADTPYPATALASHIDGLPPDPETVLPILARAWVRRYDTWAREGFAPIRAAWLERARGLGEPLVARLGTREVSGVFRDLDENGALVLETASGRRVISAGEVFFARSDS